MTQAVVPVRGINSSWSRLLIVGGPSAGANRPVAIAVRCMVADSGSWGRMGRRRPSSVVAPGKGIEQAHVTNPAEPSATQWGGNEKSPGTTGPDRPASTLTTTDGTALVRLRPRNPAVAVRVPLWIRSEAAFDRFLIRAAPAAAVALRLSLGLIFLWFGALKLAGDSPVVALVSATLPWGNPDVVVPLLGAVEVGLGIGLLVGRAQDCCCSPWQRILRVHF